MTVYSVENNGLTANCDLEWSRRKATLFGVNSRVKGEGYVPPCCKSKDYPVRIV